jgi:UDP-N-acetylglucosamine acyltransferase
MLNNKIHHTAIIEGDVKLGSGNEIGPYSLVYGPTTIGNNNLIGPHVTIGTPGQDTRNPRYDSSNAQIIIGNNNIIREYTAIQKPCYKELTRIFDNVFIMHGVHIPHDAIIQSNSTITPLVVLGGIVNILEGSTLAIGCSVHQNSVIGHYSIAAMGSPITKNIKPFAKYVPKRALTVNDYALDKYGFEELRDEIYDYVLNDKMPTTKKLIDIIDEFNLLHKNSKRGLY